LQQSDRFRFFYEIKANLSKEDIRLLSQAGVDSLQPGIESLSTPVLKLMKKGITSICNVNTLRWARHYGIYVSWNILYGFPGEQKEYYEEQREVVSSLTHLQPPFVVSRIWIERFSPIFRSSAVKGLRPTASYQYVYPSGVDLERAAYFFDGDVDDTVDDDTLEPLVEEVEKWQKRWQKDPKPTFTYCAKPDGVLIEDCRIEGKPRELLLTDLAAAVYLKSSSRPQSVRGLIDQLGEQHDRDYIIETLENLSRDGLMMRDDVHFLTLALPKEIGQDDPI
jgi:ribosomal peptide maturation radical SAM protein 1